MIYYCSSKLRTREEEGVTEGRGHARPILFICRPTGVRMSTLLTPNSVVRLR